MGSHLLLLLQAPNGNPKYSAVDKFSWCLGPHLDLCVRWWQPPGGATRTPALCGLETLTEAHRPRRGRPPRPPSNSASLQRRVLCPCERCSSLETSWGAMVGQRFDHRLMDGWEFIAEKQFGSLQPAEGDSSSSSSVGKHLLLRWLPLSAGFGSKVSVFPSVAPPSCCRGSLSEQEAPFGCLGCLSHCAQVSFAVR